MITVSYSKAFDRDLVSRDLAIMFGVLPLSFYTACCVMSRYGRVYLQSFPKSHLTPSLILQTRKCDRPFRKEIIQQKPMVVKALI